MDFTMLNRLRFGHADKKKVIFTCSDGRKFYMPMRVIAFDRAFYYAENKDVDGVQVSLDDDTIELFMEDYWPIDWLRNNMSYDEYKHFLVQIKNIEYREDAVRDGFVNGEHAVE